MQSFKKVLLEIIMGLPMAKGNSICVKTYLKPELFAEIAQEAEKVNLRRKGLPLRTQKPHGFANETLANTDGIARFLKYCYSQYRLNEAERLLKTAHIKQKEKELEEEKRKLGMIQ